MVYRVKNFSKYGNRKQVYNGRRYHSALEADYAFQLDMRVKAKQIKSWEPQVKISLDVGKFHICNYYMDFVVTHLDGSREYVECKGMITRDFVIKRRLFEALLPKIDKKGSYTIIRR
jgi:hypothetical protein